MPKIFVGEPFCAVFQKKFMDKRGGVSRFSVEIFLSHSAENFRKGGGNPLVFYYLRVSKKFMLQRVMSRFSVSSRSFSVSQCRKIS